MTLMPKLLPTNPKTSYLATMRLIILAPGSNETIVWLKKYQVEQTAIKVDGWYNFALSSSVRSIFALAENLTPHFQKRDLFLMMNSMAFVIPIMRRNLTEKEVHSY